MDNKLFYGREDGWEAYDFLIPRLPKFYRYRILFWDFIGSLANGDEHTIENLMASDDSLKLLYKVFYNMTDVGKMNPITICDVKLCDCEELEKMEDTQQDEYSVYDIESHRDEVELLIRSNEGYKKVIKAWEIELMSDCYYGKTKK